MAGGRKVDQFRDGAFSFEIGDADDPSGITGMLVLDDKLHVVKEKGIYVVILPDDIDPGRTKPSLPRAQRRELNYGSNDPYVGRVLLTASELFKKDRLPPECNPEKALNLTYGLLKDLIAMREMYESLDRAQKSAEDNSQSEPDSRGNVVLPSVPDIQERVDLYLLKARHGVRKLNDLSALFFGNAVKKGKWLEKLLEIVVRREGEGNLFATFLSKNGWVLMRVTAMRNAIEHPKSTHKVVVSNYSHGQGSAVTPPSVEVIHPEWPHFSIPITTMMKETADHISVIAEVFIANFAQIHAISAGGFPVFVHQFPVEKRRYPTVQYGYAVEMGDQIVPFG